MARKAKRTKRSASRVAPNDLAQLKVRLPEVLRRQLELDARRSGHSMNAEIVKRLNNSFRQLDGPKLVAQALIRDLDDDILNEIEDTLRRQRGEDDAANDWRKEALEREAERAGDAFMEHMRDVEREGGPEEEEPK